MVVVGLAGVALVVLVSWRLGLIRAVMKVKFVGTLFKGPEASVRALAVEVAVAVAEVDYVEGEALLVRIPDRDWPAISSSLEPLRVQALAVLADDGHPAPELRFDRTPSELITVERASLRTRVVGPGPQPQQSQPVATLWVGADRHPLCLFAEERVTLGREPRAGRVSIADPRISSTHAVVEVSAGELWITDLKSTNGTHVNNAKVSRCRLGDGDVLRLGDTTVTVEVHLLPAGAVHLVGGAPPSARRRASAPSLSVTRPIDIAALFAAEDAEGVRS